MPFSLLEGKTPMGIRTLQRKDRIRALLERNGRVTVPEIVSSLGVSRVTARRYLWEMEREGLLERVYGGAVGVGREPLPGFTFPEKAVRNLVAKREIARRALAFLSAGETVFLDSGTTVLELARLVGDSGPGLTAATNSLPAALELLRNDRVEIMLCGGFLRRELHDLFGPFSTSEIERLSFSVAFLGVDGISARSGLSTTDQATARLEEAVMRRSARVFILADASKIGRVALIPYGEIGASDGAFTVITTAGAAEGEVAGLRRLGIEVVFA